MSVVESVKDLIKVPTLEAPLEHVARTRAVTE